MARRHQPFNHACYIAPLLLAACTLQPAAQAEDATRSYAIPSQSLGDALTTFADQSNIKLVFNPELTRGLSTKGLSGKLTPEQGLGQLLQGTGLNYRFLGNGSAILEKTPVVRPNDGATLGKVTVTAHSGEGAKPYQETVSTAGSRMPVEIARLPQSVQVVMEQAIKDQGALTIGNILKGIPSANVGQSRYSRFPKFTIRGFRAIQQRNGFRTQFMSDTDFSALSNIERFEVLKGPGSAAYGNGSMGGLVNVVTKRPKKEFGGFIAGVGGEYDQKGVQFDMTGAVLADGALTARLTGDIERSGSFIDHQGLDRDNLALALAWDDGGPVRGFLNMEYQQRDTKPNPGIPAPGQIIGRAPRDAYLGEPNFDYLSINTPLLQTWLDIDVADNWTVSPRFQYMEFNGEQTQVFLGAVENRRKVGRTGRMNFHENDFMYTGQLDIKGQFNTGPFEHQVLLGGEYEDMTGKGGWLQLNPFQAIDPLNPIYDNRLPSLSGRKVMSSDKRVGAFYFQDLVAVTDRFDLFGGVRQTNIAGTQHSPAGTKGEVDVDDVSFQVGGAYRILDPVSLFVGYGTGFDADATFGQHSFTGKGLQPEFSKQIEGGVKLALPGGLTGTGSLFEINRTNVSSPDRDHAGPYWVQVGEARSRGAEFDLSYPINEQWFVQGGYAFIDARITKSTDPAEQGKRLFDVAEHQANLWTRYKFDSGLLKNLSVGAGANFVGKRPGDNANHRDRDLRAYTTVDLSAAYQWKNVRAELFALNMLDKHYYTSADFGTGVFAGSPRQIYGRLVLEF